MNRIRNPFGRKPPTVNGVTSGQDENQRPTLASDAASQRSSFAGSRASSSLSIPKKNEEPNEYKLSGMRQFSKAHKIGVEHGLTQKVPSRQRQWRVSSGESPDQCCPSPQMLTKSSAIASREKEHLAQSCPIERGKVKPSQHAQRKRAVFNITRVL